MAYFEYFSEAEVLQVHEASLRVLNEVGVDFGYLPALELFKKAGCRVDGQRVYFPPKLVEAQVAKAPSQFTLHARNPNHNVIIGGNNSAFAPCYGPPLISNLDEGRREAGLEDFRNFVKLTHSSEFQDVTGGVMVEPNDIPYERRTAG
jgi:trimethylamine--corrinoid protein Co-methyltransferase